MTALISEAANAFAFGPFLLIPERQQLLENQEALRVGGRALDLLTALVQRPGEVVSKRELIARVWPGLVVEEGNLKVNISALRRLLGDGADPARYIETVVGTGYRFVAEVRCLAHRASPQASRASQASQASQASSNRRTLPQTRASNLPTLRSPPCGRDEAIAAVLRDLRDSRLVSIVGPGGIGKTTVALAAADRGAGDFRSGAWFVDLARLTDPALVPVAIADALRESAGPSLSSLSLSPSPLAQTRNGTERDHEVLLVLDNCEHLIGAVASCADQLLAGTRQVKLLATSREPLCIRGELVRRLSGLALPPSLPSASSGRDRLRAEEAIAFAAVQLFVQRASEPQRAFHLDDANAEEVVAICRRLEGHALAIERVARRVGTLGIAGTLDHLARRFHMFDGHHEGPERHRTLTATVASSYDLLSASEQAVLRRLSIFEGPFSLTAACRVGGPQAAAQGAAEALKYAAVVEDVGQLVAKSLLVAEARDGEMQYRQTPLTRAFAIEQLIALGEREDAARLAAFLSEDPSTGRKTPGHD